jgi:hypothetical protein
MIYEVALVCEVNIKCLLSTRKTPVSLSRFPPL